MNAAKQEHPWLGGILKIQPSVIPAILPKVLFFSAFGYLVSWLYRLGWPVSNPGLGNLVPTLVLGLLLVFRTNTAYDRFWEGRKAWGGILTSARNISQQVWVLVDEKDPEDRTHKQAILRLTIAFALSTKLYLRGEPVKELESFVSPEQYNSLQTTDRPPLKIAFWIRDYLNTQYKRGCLDVYQMNAIVEELHTLLGSLAACERILTTPLPAAYSIHLKQLLFIYCSILPFELVSELGWLTGFSVGLISFTLFGIEEIGLEIENPFGHDPNDLPLDTICQGIEGTIEDLSTLDSSARSHPLESQSCQKPSAATGH